MVPAAAVPLVAVTALVLRHRSVRTAAICAGGVAYLAYNGVLFLFGTPFNRLFLLYVAMTGLLSWALGFLIRRLLTAVGPPPRRSQAVAVSSALLLSRHDHLAEGHPRGRGQRPPGRCHGRDGAGDQPRLGADLVFWLPASFLLAIALWQGRRWSGPISIASADLLVPRSGQCRR